MQAAATDRELELSTIEVMRTSTLEGRRARDLLVGERPLTLAQVRGFVAAQPMPSWSEWVQARDAQIEDRGTLPGPGRGDPFDLANVDLTYPYKLPDGTCLDDRARQELGEVAARTMALRSAAAQRGYASKAAATAALVEMAAGDALTTELLGTLAGLIRPLAWGGRGQVEDLELLMSAAWDGVMLALADFKPGVGDLKQHVMKHAEREVSAARRAERLPGVADRVAKHAWNALGLLAAHEELADDPFELSRILLESKRSEVEARCAADGDHVDAQALEADVNRQMSRNHGGVVLAGELPWVLADHLHQTASVEVLAEAGGAWEPSHVDSAAGMSTIVELVLARVPMEARELVLAQLTGADTEEMDVLNSQTAGVSSSDLRRWVRQVKSVMGSPHAQYCYLGEPKVSDVPAGAVAAPCGDVWGS